MGNDLFFPYIFLGRLTLLLVTRTRVKMHMVFLKCHLLLKGQHHNKLLGKI